MQQCLQVLSSQRSRCWADTAVWQRRRRSGRQHASGCTARPGYKLELPAVQFSGVRRDPTYAVSLRRASEDMQPPGPADTSENTLTKHRIDGNNRPRLHWRDNVAPPSEEAAAASAVPSGAALCLRPPSQPRPVVLTWCLTPSSVLQQLSPSLCSAFMQYSQSFECNGASAVVQWAATARAPRPASKLSRAPPRSSSYTVQT